MWTEISMEVVSLTPGRIQVDAVDGFGCLSEEIIAGKAAQAVRRRLGNEVQRVAKRYDNDRHSKVIGLRLLLLAAVIMAAKALPPQTNIRQMTKRLL